MGAEVNQPTEVVEDAPTPMTKAGTILKGTQAGDLGAAVVREILHRGGSRGGDRQPSV